MKNNSPFKIQHSSFANGAPLYQQMSESALLDSAIRKNLEELGYGE